MLDKLKRLVKKFGGTMVDKSSGRWKVYQIEAPVGMYWNSDGIHCLKMDWMHGDSEFRKDAIEDALERVRYGVDACNDPDCDYCLDMKEGAV